MPRSRYERGSRQGREGRQGLEGELFEFVKETLRIASAAVLNPAGLTQRTQRGNERKGGERCLSTCPLPFSLRSLPRCVLCVQKIRARFTEAAADGISRPRGAAPRDGFEMVAARRNGRIEVLAPLSGLGPSFIRGAPGSRPGLHSGWPCRANGSTGGERLIYLRHLMPAAAAGLSGVQVQVKEYLPAVLRTALQAGVQSPRWREAAGASRFIFSILFRSRCWVFGRGRWGHR